MGGGVHAPDNASKYGSIPNQQSINQNRFGRKNHEKGGWGGVAQDIHVDARTAGGVAEDGDARGGEHDGTRFEQRRVHTAGLGSNALPCPAAEHVRHSCVDAAAVKKQGASDVGDEAGEVTQRAVRGAVAARWAVVAQGDRHCREGKRISHRQHGLTGSAGYDAKLEGGREHLGLDVTDAGGRWRWR